MHLCNIFPDTMEDLSQISLFVGDQEFAVKPTEIKPGTSLNSYLREKVHLTATKRSCLEGGCGACIVVVTKLDPDTKKPKTFAVNSCLVPIYACEGWKIVTNEGIGNPKIGYNDLQKKLASNNGSQCGFCSSGMIMNMYGLLNSGQKEKLTQKYIEDSFGGNICRCTGFRAILDTWKSFAEIDIEDYRPCKEICPFPCRKPLGTVKEIKFADDKTTWLKVYHLKDLLDKLLEVEKPYMLVGGNTAQGVVKPKPPKTYIDISSVEELTTWSKSGDRLILGANLSLNKTREIFYETAKNDNSFSYLAKMADHMDLVANVPVRNIGTLAGNLMLKHGHPEFQSDIFLIMETVEAKLLIVDTSSDETIITPAKFLNLNMDEKVIKNIILKGYDKDYIYTSYKIMSRAQNTAATVNAGFLLKIDDGVVKKARIIYGNITPKFVHASDTEKLLENKNLFDNSTLKQVYESLDKEIQPIKNPPEASPEYRKSLAISLFYKMVLSIAPSSKIATKNKSGGQLLERPLSKGTQEYSTIKERYPVSQPMVKLEALAQTTGQAEYIEDIPDRPGQLFCSYVLANAPPLSKIKKIDTSKALKHPGVVAFFGKDDIPGSNVWSPPSASIFQIEELLFSDGTLQYYDQPVGIIVATSEDAAEEGANLVEVHTEKGSEFYLHVRDVVNAPEDVRKQRISKLESFEPKSKGNDVKQEVKGEFYMGEQYHFHMELQCCNVVPTEDGLDVYSSTQWMDATQIAIGAVLNIKNADVNVRVRRLGGAFGGKILRSVPVACAAALAAFKLRKPVKIRLPLETNMKIMGKRDPLLVKYKAGVNAKGIIQYLDADLYCDYGVGGNEVIYTMLASQFKNGYKTDTWTMNLYKVKTDTPGKAYTRAPGTMTGLAAIEALMEHIAYTLKVEPYEMKLANTDPKHEKIFEFTKDMNQWADIKKRQDAIQEFNKKNRWRKRGMAMVPMSWILEVHAGFVALVSIYHADGSVAITHSGIEMGQGINTKVAQVAAYKLGIPMDLIKIYPSTALTGPNASTTGGSITTEAVCFATMQACEVLLKRMEPTRKKMNNPTWQELVKKCFGSYMNLSTTAGFEGKPDLQEYFIYGISTCEVEVDILTGKHEILRVDIIEDVGDTMNPTIDIGQTEGAFVMGIGYYTTEEIILSDEGKVLTNRTWNYKPPGPKDIPIDFRIKFPGNNPNKVGILNSKAIAEPPCCLSISVPLAIRNAVSYARMDADDKKLAWYEFNGCSTIENTFMNSLNTYNQYTL